MVTGLALKMNHRRALLDNVSAGGQQHTIADAMATRASSTLPVVIARHRP